MAARKKTTAAERRAVERGAGRAFVNAAGGSLFSCLRQAEAAATKKFGKSPNNYDESARAKKWQKAWHTAYSKCVDATTPASASWYASLRKRQSKRK